MALYKRGGVWWMSFRFNNRHVQKSTRSKNKREAETIARAYHTQLAKGEVGLEEKPPAPVFSAAMKDFLAWSESEHAAKPNTHKRYLTSSKALLRFFGDASLNAITPDQIEKYKVWRRRQTKLAPALKLKKKKHATTTKAIKPATVNRELACLKALFNHFIKADILTLANPVSRVKFLAENNEQMRVVTVDEERSYLLAASQPLQDVAALIVNTGARPEEICSLRWSDVNLTQRYIQIAAGKTKAARRRLRLNERALEVLTRRLADAAGEYLFAGRGSDGAKPIIKLNNAHNGAVKRSKVAAFRLYDLRHTFATRAAEAGVDLVTLAAILGHSRIQMVLRYAHPSETHQFDAMEKIEKHLNAAKKA